MTAPVIAAKHHGVLRQLLLSRLFPDAGDGNSTSSPIKSRHLDCRVPYPTTCPHLMYPSTDAVKPQRPSL
ncbi:hypothetical protein ACFX11_024921 [Malus domestica]